MLSILWYGWWAALSECLGFISFTSRQLIQHWEFAFKQKAARRDLEDFVYVQGKIGGNQSVSDARPCCCSAVMRASSTPSLLSMIELDDWILAVSLDDREVTVGWIDRVLVVGGAAVSVCPTRICA